MISQTYETMIQIGNLRYSIRNVRFRAIAVHYVVVNIVYYVVIQIVFIAVSIIVYFVVIQIVFVAVLKHNDAIEGSEGAM